MLFASQSREEQLELLVQARPRHQPESILAQLTSLEHPQDQIQVLRQVEQAWMQEQMLEWCGNSEADSDAAISMELQSQEQEASPFVPIVDGEPMPPPMMLPPPMPMARPLPQYRAPCPPPPPPVGVLTPVHAHGDRPSMASIVRGDAPLRPIPPPATLADHWPGLYNTPPRHHHHHARRAR